MNKWLIRKANKEYKKISTDFNINKVLAKIISNRDIEYNQIPKYLNPTSENSMHDPFLMKDMDKAVDIIIRALDSNKHIRIVGDYDQDGNSATMTLIDGLLLFTENVSYVIPHRIHDGYGISKGIVESAKKEGVDLIITCDNGISSFEPIDYAKELGLEVIVTDHHQIVKNEYQEDVLPNADAVLNPNRSDCSYPFKKLCGAGVAFKLMYGLYTKLEADLDYLMDLLEYVAMGTVADIVDLLDENRFFVKEGLKKIHKTNNYGIKALIREAKLEQESIDVYKIGFILGPCINAAGRLDSATLGIELFLEENMERVDEIAQKLVELNEKRKSLTEDGLKLVLEKIEEEKLYENDLILVKEKTIHESLAGIIAGRVKELYNRPTIVFTSAGDEGVLKGSGRSISEYDMYENIFPFKGLLKSFGGHPMACGLSLFEENFDIFYSGLLESSKLTPQDLISKKYLDTQLYIDKISFELVDLISELEPYGMGNPKPIFGDRNIRVLNMKILGKNKNTLKLEMEARGRIVEGILFSNSEKIKEIYDFILSKKKGQYEYPIVDILYYPDINEFMGNKNLQLKIQDIR
ncbi:MAG: single-stranded-DNA-specific exonuclease RecJ [Lagierella massiliensis]|nr:single-stranded-DNA-specific exonuclease RecJ [Lagierella massiliensis]